MYSANHYCGPEFAPGQFQERRISASNLGPQVIQFNFFGQESQIPKLLSGLNFPNESGSDKDSDFDYGTCFDRDPQGYPLNCTLNANNFARDLNNNCSEDDTGYVHTQSEFVTQINPRKHYNQTHRKVSRRGTGLNVPSQNCRNSATDWKDQNLSSGFRTLSDEKSFNGPNFYQDSNFMKASLPDTSSRQDEPEHYSGMRLEPIERHNLNKLHEKNAPHLQPRHPLNMGRGAHIPNSTYDNIEKSNNHKATQEVTHVDVHQDQFVKPVRNQPIETSASASTQPDDKKPAVAKYDLSNCRYCRVAKQPYDHPLYNELREVVCAKLSQYKCPFCNATGKIAHTLKYCKENPILKGELAAIKKLGKGKAPEEHRDEAFRLKKRKLKCRYCRKLKKDFDHLFKDAEGVTCPELFKVVCELCGATGKKAHSKEYCKQEKGENLQDAGVAISTPEFHVPEDCNSAEPFAGDTTTVEVLKSTEQDPIPYELLDGDASRRSLKDLHNSSTVLTSTLCVSDYELYLEPTVEIVVKSGRLDVLKPVSEVRRNLDAQLHVQSGFDTTNLCEKALAKAETSEILVIQLTKTAAVELTSRAGKEKPSAFEEGEEAMKKPSALEEGEEAAKEKPSVLEEAVEEAVEEKPSALEEAVDEKPSALEEAVDEKPSALEEAVDEKPSALEEAVDEKPSALEEAVDEKPSALEEAVDEKPSALEEAVYEEPSALEEAVYEEPSALEEAVDEKPSALEEAVDEKPSALEEAVDEKPSALEEAVDEEPSALEEAVDEKPSALEEAVDEKPSALEEAVDEKPSALEEAVDEKPSALEEAVDEKPSALEEAVDEKPSALEEAVDEKPSALEEAVDEKPSALEEAVDEKPSALEEAVDEKPSALEEAVDEKPSALEEAVDEKPSALEEAVDEKPSALEEAVDEKPSVLEEAVDEKPSALEEAVDEKPSALEEAVDEKPSALEEAVDEKPSALEEAVDEKPSALEEAVDEKPSALEEAVDEKPSALEEAVDEKPSALEEAVDEKPSALEEAVDEKPSALEEAVDEKPSALEEAVDEKPSALEEAVDEKPSALEEAVDEKLSALEEAVDEKLSALEEAVDKKPSALEEAVDEKHSALEEAVDEKPSALEEAVEEKPSATRCHLLGRIETLL